jgi:hypothetical protein
MTELKGMPYVIVNMGGEMLYILEQRLQAQSIVEDKSLRVLQDVISTMFSQKFIGELFKPQKIYSNSSTRQIFDRLAHSSIMRLNESSMSKLYDLMTMGAKYQTLSVASASDIAQVTMNHMTALRGLVRSSSVIKLVDDAIETMTALFDDMTPGQFMLLRQTLCRFFQDRRVKVSLFLQDGIQSLDGLVNINHKGQLPYGAEVPGTVRYFSDDEKVAKEQRFDLPNAVDVKPAPSSPPDWKTAPRPCTLGSNLYSKERRKKGKRKDRGNAPPAQKDYEVDENKQKAAKAELNNLAAMMGALSGESKEGDKGFNVVNLFPDTQLAQGSGGEGGDIQAEVITFDDKDARSYAENLTRGFDDLDVGGGDQEDDDLLDLMDGMDDDAI